MIKYINQVNTAADAAKGADTKGSKNKEDSAAANAQLALNREIAALGLDAILKMVTYFLYIHFLILVHFSVMYRHRFCSFSKIISSMLICTLEMYSFGPPEGLVAILS